MTDAQKHLNEALRWLEKAQKSYTEGYFHNNVTAETEIGLLLVKIAELERELGY